MAKVVYTETFVAEAAKIKLEGKRAEVRDAISLLGTLPELGSRALPKSISLRYGDSVRKLVVSPFDVVYDYDADTDTVYVLGLLHQREAW